VKFAMEEQTLVRLGQRTQTESDDLGALVRRLVEAAEPLTGTFNGPAKASFNAFKARTDEIADALNSALAGIVGSIAGQNRAFVTAADDGAATHERAESSSDFGDQAFLARIAPRA
jgi:uncharacterized protein YukE